MEPAFRDEVGVVDDDVRVENSAFVVVVQDDRDFEVGKVLERPGAGKLGDLVGV